MLDDESNRDFVINNRGAVEQSDGSYVDRSGTISWFNDDGEWHREEGPAVIYIYPDAEVWWLNNIIYSFNDWLKLSTVSDEQKMMLRLQYA